MVAGTGTGGSAANQFADPGFFYIDANDNMYVADHHNYRVQRWNRSATTGETVVNIGTGTDHPEGITFDKNGYMYITGHNYERVIRYPPNFSAGTNVAGQPGSGSTALPNLKSPLGLIVDDNLNIYIAERDNQRVMKWAPGASSGTIVVPDTNKKFYGILLSLYNTNQVYVSSEDLGSVYLWTFNAGAPAVTLVQVNGTPTTLGAPRGIRYDTYGNLYVADRTEKRIVMYCVNSTIGRVVVGGTGSTPVLAGPYDVDFDSDLNLYVADGSGQRVVKYDLL